MVLEVEKLLCHDPDIVPIAVVVGLNNKKSFRFKNANDFSQEKRLDHASMAFARSGVRLWMVAVQLPHACRRKELSHQPLAIDHTKPEIGEATLIAPTRGVSNHDRQQIRG
jgi:hypothetical protein